MVVGPEPAGFLSHSQNANADLRMLRPHPALAIIMCTRLPIQHGVFHPGRLCTDSTCACPNRRTNRRELEAAHFTWRHHPGTRLWPSRSKGFLPCVAKDCGRTRMWWDYVHMDLRILGSGGPSRRFNSPHLQADKPVRARKTLSEMTTGLSGSKGGSEHWSAQDF
jgi:hypothetical protein